MKILSLIALLFLMQISTVGAEGSLDQMKALTGDWVGKFSDGSTVNISYSTISGGNAVMEILNLPDGTEMRSIYYNDSGALMMTHYCHGGNQPRLKTSGADGPEDLVFSFVDVTNVSVPEKSAYLYKVAFHFDNQDSFSQDITWMIQGKESTSTLNLVRKK